MWTMWRRSMAWGAMSSKQWQSYERRQHEKWEMFQKKNTAEKIKYLFSRSVCLKTSSSLWDINNNINVNIKKIKVLWKYVANQVILISLEVWLYCIIWNAAEIPLKIVRKVGKTAVHKLGSCKTSSYNCYWCRVINVSFLDKQINK